MSETPFDNLSGYWTGVYDYVTAEEPVPFNAVISDEAGAVAGECIEPNTFAPTRDRELFASLEGDCIGAAIQFVKRYEDLPGAGHAVRYVGVVNAARTQISGRWTIAPGWSGDFVMNRAGARIASAARRSASTPLT